MNERQLPIYRKDFSIHSDRPPEIKYKLDLERVNSGEREERRTVAGIESTLIALVPPKGCGFDCDFCSIKHIANPNFPVTNEQGGVEAAKISAQQVGEVLREHPGTDTLKLFNAGNILYGTERPKSELNEAFWPALMAILKQVEVLKALEIEVRIDEFVGPTENQDGTKSRKEILRDRIRWIDNELKKMGKRLRCILPLEYIESRIISQQKKFPKSFSSEGKSETNCEQAINFMKEHEIEWLSYAMLGGRLDERSLTSEEAVSSAAHTTLFGLEHGAREVIINSQYLDPINLWEQEKDSIKYYVPTEKDMSETLELIVSGLNIVPKVGGEILRVRLTTDKEDIIEETIGPDVSPKFRQLVLGFNNAFNQATFFAEHMQNMRFNDKGKWV